MDIHLVVQVVIDYYRDMVQWSTARCLNQECKRIVNAQKHDNDCWGRRTFIRPHFCEVCGQTSDCGMLNYWSSDFTSIMHITHCQDWPCKMSAIRSMLAHCKADNLYRLRTPFRPTSTVNIPRSDGSETVGCCNPFYLLWRRRWMVYTHWNDGQQEYVKLVPLTQYTQEAPKLVGDTL